MIKNNQRQFISFCCLFFFFGLCASLAALRLYIYLNIPHRRETI